MPLHVEGHTVLVPHGGGLVADPDDAPVTGEQSVLGAKRLRPVACLGQLGEHAVAIVGVEQTLEQLGLSQPILDRVVEQTLDLRADEQRRRRLLDRSDVRHTREVRRQRAVSRLDRAELLGHAQTLPDVGGDENCPRSFVRPVDERRERDRDAELAAVLAAVHVRHVLQALALPSRLDEVWRVGDHGQRLTLDLVGGVAVHGLAAGAPADDVALRVDADDRLGRRGA